MKRKFFYALLSAAVAFGLWLYVITTDPPEWEETFYNIPVVLENETVLNDHGLMLALEKEPTVALKLSGSRRDLMKLNSSNITLVADLAKIYETGKQYVSYNIRFPGNVPSNSIEVVGQTPQEIPLMIVERKTREVPIVLDFVGAVPEGFRTDKENIVLSDQSVTVTGPAALLDSIARAEIQVDLTGRTETISQSYAYTFRDQNGEVVETDQLTADITEVKLNLVIQRYKDIALELNVIPGGGATLENTAIEMDMTSIRVSGSEQLLADLPDVLVLGDLKLGELREDCTIDFEIKLDERITNLTGKDTVTVTVKFNGLVTKTLQVTDIRARNLPGGMTADIQAKVLTVTVRGTPEQIEKLTAKDLYVSVDLSGAEVGASTYKALVYANSAEFSTVGAVGAYRVDVEVKLDHDAAG